MDEADLWPVARLIIEQFNNPPPRLHDLLANRRDRLKERSELVAAIELELLLRSHQIDLEVSAADPKDDELAVTFVRSLNATDFLCKLANLRPNGDHGELRRVVLQTIRLYNALFDGLFGVERYSQPIFRLGTLLNLNNWYREIFAGFHVHRALDAETVRKLLHVSEPGWMLPYIVDETGISDGRAEFRFEEMRPLHQWFERRLGFLPEGREFILESYDHVDMDVPEEHLFDELPEAKQNLLMTALGGVASLEQLARYADHFPSEHVLDQALDGLVRESNPLLAWLDFGHITTLATLYARADRLDLTVGYANAGTRRFMKPRLVWERQDSGA